MKAFAFAAALLVAAGCGGANSSDEAVGTIAFAGAECCGYPEGVPTDIWLMNADGSDRRRLTRHPSSEVDPSWAPDGSKIVFRAEEGLAVVSESGAGRRSLLRSGVHPLWSPQGELIAFTREGDGYVVNSNGAGSRRLFRGGYLGDWSPDGTEIALVREEGGIFVIGADGKGLRRVSRAGSHDLYPNWSPDGKRIAFLGLRGNAVVSADVYVMNADGTDERRLTKFPAGPRREGGCFHGSIRGIDWSPDGEWIAFGRTFLGCKRLGDVYVVRPDGSDLTRLTTSGFAVDPAWRP